jgi:nanoRNase/pAp phosphatase (c-di-AMP/oligoRNAs hydrolase)
MRSNDGAVDVSLIARREGGGGHRRAAGFGSDRSYEELVAFMREEVAAQLD